MNIQSDWPEKESLVWIYSHKAIINDFSDSLIICNYVKNVFTNTLLQIKDVPKRFSFIYKKWGFDAFESKIHFGCG